METWTNIETNISTINILIYVNVCISCIFLWSTQECRSKLSRYI